MKKKKVFMIIGGILILFALFNIGWFTWRSTKYSCFTDEMERAAMDTVFIPRYCLTDSENYDYLVKYPDYLSFTGNLSVGMPASDNNLFTDALIIWPQLDGSYEYGVLLYEEDGSGYNIYIDRNGNPLESENQAVVERHYDNICILLQKADERWNIIP